MCPRYLPWNMGPSSDIGVLKGWANAAESMIETDYLHPWDLEAFENQED
jgi:hypothetical protein